MIQFAWSDKIQNFVFKSWLESKGQGVKIALLDTGVDLGHSALKHLDKPGHKFNVAAPGFDPTNPTATGNDDVLDLHRKKGHGTQCVSVLASLADGNNQLFGFAPAATIFILKVNTVDHKFFKVSDFLKGVEAAVNLGVDIIVASISYPLEDVSVEGISAVEVDRVFGLVSKAGILFFSALPNMDEEATWTSLANGFFPTLRPESVNVGAISQSIFQKRKAEIALEPTIHYLVTDAVAPFCKIKNQYEETAVSSSYATYLVAGVAAIYLSSIKNREKATYQPRSLERVLKGIGQKFLPLPAADKWEGTSPVFYKNSMAISEENEEENA